MTVSKVLLLMLALLMLLDDTTYVGSQEREHLVDTKRYPLVEQYKNSASPHARIEKIAVFILASLSNAIELGEQAPRYEYTDYFSRLLAAKSTWAAHVDHFYGVTGEGRGIYALYLSLYSHFDDLVISYMTD